MLLPSFNWQFPYQFVGLEALKEIKYGEAYNVDYLKWHFHHVSLDVQGVATRNEQH